MDFYSIIHEMLANKKIKFTDLLDAKINPFDYSLSAYNKINKISMAILNKDKTTVLFLSLLQLTKVRQSYYAIHYSDITWAP